MLSTIYKVFIIIIIIIITHQVQQNRVSFKCAAAAKGADNNDGGTDPNQDVGGVLEVDCGQLHVDVQLYVGPYSKCQHRNARDLQQATVIQTDVNISM